jgi:hypothetical protein
MIEFGAIIKLLLVLLLLLLGVRVRVLGVGVGVGFGFGVSGLGSMIACGAMLQGLNPHPYTPDP